MGLDGVLADEKLLRNFAVAHTLSNQGKDVHFAGSDAEGLALAGIGGEGGIRRCRSLGSRGRLVRAGQFKAEADTENGKGYGDQPSVDLEGMLDDQKTVLHPFQCGNQEAAGKTVDQDVAMDGLEANI